MSVFLWRPCCEHSHQSACTETNFKNMSESRKQRPENTARICATQTHIRKDAHRQQHLVRE